MRRVPIDELSLAHFHRMMCHMICHVNRVCLCARAGKDHFLWLSNDQGACEIDDDPLYQNPIKIV